MPPSRMPRSPVQRPPVLRGRVRQGLPAPGARQAGRADIRPRRDVRGPAPGADAPASCRCIPDRTARAPGTGSHDLGAVGRRDEPEQLGIEQVDNASSDSGVGEFGGACVEGQLEGARLELDAGPHTRHGGELRLESDTARALDHLGVVAAHRFGHLGVGAGAAHDQFVGPGRVPQNRSLRSSSTSARLGRRCRRGIARRTRESSRTGRWKSHPECP